MNRSLAGLLLLLPACVKFEPPPAPVPREATSVQASMGQAWDAVIDLFAMRNIPIRTIERASGIIATEGLNVDSADGVKWAYCGKRGRTRYHPNTAIYNVLVRGDSIGSTVRATVRWEYETLKSRDLECTSHYTWELGLEEDVRVRAEARQRTAGMGIQVPPNSAPRRPEAASGATDIPPATTPPPAHRSARSEPLPSPPTPPRNSSPAAQTSQSSARSSSELLSFPAFKRAIGDLERLGMIEGFREAATDTLVVELTAQAVGAAEHNLTNLYSGYRSTVSYSPEAAIELYLGAQRVGLYVLDGLAWDQR